MISQNTAGASIDNHMKNIIRFFDRIEDGVRKSLSRHPIPYAVIGGVGIVLFWKGVWDTADLFPFLTGPILMVISSVILLLTGLFVSFFIGDQIVLSGLKGEKKIVEKTEQELRDERREEHSALESIKKEEDAILKEIQSLKEYKGP